MPPPPSSNTTTTASPHFPPPSLLPPPPPLLHLLLLRHHHHQGRLKQTSGLGGLKSLQTDAEIAEGDVIGLATFVKGHHFTTLPFLPFFLPLFQHTIPSQ
jgi:hypothetical protein